MKRELTIIYDHERRPGIVKISSPDNDPWNDLGILLEGLGVLVGACLNEGKAEHNGQSVEEYLKAYIGKVCNDYRTLTVHKG